MLSGAKYGKYAQIWSKPWQKVKSIIYEVLCISSDLIKLYLILSGKPLKKCFARRRQDGENVLASEHQFNLLEMILMKFSVRN